MTAKAHDLTEECESILEASGLTEDEIHLSSIGKPSQPLKPLVPTYKSNWPVKAASHSFFEKALLGQMEGGLDGGDPGPRSNGVALANDEEEGVADRNGHLDAEEDDDTAGWDMGEDINVEVENDFVEVDSVEGGAGSSEASLWARNSPVAADHVAGGSFESAMQLLNRQVGAVNFEPLKPRFLEIYQASKTYLPASSGLPPLINYVRRTVDETDARKVLPIIPRDLESIAANDVQAGYSAMKSNNLEEGVKIFRRVLHTLLVNAVSTHSEVAEVCIPSVSVFVLRPSSLTFCWQAKKVISTAAEYTVAMSIELERRALPTDDASLKRSLELSAYFTIPKLEVIHRQLALNAALSLAASKNNFASALSFANRILANGATGKMGDRVRSSTIQGLSLPR
jgi:coatomer protein complex subunit alpha (xenin)